MTLSKAFTLVELLIVIIVIAVLAAIAIPKFATSSLQAKESALRENLWQIRQAADRCEADTGLVMDIDDLTSSTPPTRGWIRGPMGTDWPESSVPDGTWKGPYLSAVPINPITGDNTFETAGSSAASWTNYSAQSFNASCYYYPGPGTALDGTEYRTWQAFAPCSSASVEQSNQKRLNEENKYVRPCLACWLCHIVSGVLYWARFSKADIKVDGSI